MMQFPNEQAMGYSGHQAGTVAGAVRRLGAAVVQIVKTPHRKTGHPVGSPPMAIGYETHTAGVVVAVVGSGAGAGAHCGIAADQVGRPPDRFPAPLLVPVGSKPTVETATLRCLE
jgi:hypothetical protein